MDEQKFVITFRPCTDAKALIDAAKKRTGLSQNAILNLLVLRHAEQMIASIATAQTLPSITMAPPRGRS
jgi:hypothetical protein